MYCCWLARVREPEIAESVISTHKNVYSLKATTSTFTELLASFYSNNFIKKNSLQTNIIGLPAEVTTILASVFFYEFNTYATHPNGNLSNKMGKKRNKKQNHNKKKIRYGKWKLQHMKLVDTKIK